MERCRNDDSDQEPCDGGARLPDVRRRDHRRARVRAQADRPVQPHGLRRAAPAERDPVIALVLAALRTRARVRVGKPTGKYVRKPRIGPPARHRAGTLRPSYSHPATRARRAVRSVLTPPRVRRALRSALPTIPRRTARPRLAARESAPPRSTRAIGRAVVRYVPRTVNAAVRAWLNDPRRPRRSHRHPDAGHRRQHIYLPNIGWCWETDEYPRVSA